MPRCVVLQRAGCVEIPKAQSHRRWKGPPAESALWLLRALPARRVLVGDLLQAELSSASNSSINPSIIARPRPQKAGSLASRLNGASNSE